MNEPVYRILVAVDFSPDAEAALDEAVRLARRVGGELELVHILPAPPVLLGVPGFASDVAGELADFPNAKERLAALRAERIGPAVPTRIGIRIGEPVWGILDEIRLSKPDLVVVGSHGRGALLRALMGSVSAAVARRSPVPVLVVPSTKRADAVQVLETEEPRPPTVATVFAYSCSRCGHILSKLEASERCRRCGASGARWDSAEMVPGPVDAMAPAVGEGALQNEIAATAGNEPAGLFATSPPGTEGYSVNPELRVRY